MDVFTGPEAIPADFGPTVVTLGNFDGVHRGHRVVLDTVASLARERGLRSLVLTFDPHPRTVHDPDAPVAQICGLDERLARIAETGVDAVVVQEYSLGFAAQSAEEFACDYLIGRLGAAVIAVGRDVRFGAGNAGDLELLRRLGAERGVEVVVIDDVGEEVSHRFSSTSIREHLDAGDVAGAAAELGTAHVLTGTVVHGEARGRELGFPTANLSADADGLIPADGVYAGWVVFGSKEGRWPAAISVGTNPTFDGEIRTVEAYVLDVVFEDFDVYGETMSVEFAHRIRGQVAFTGIEPLIEQMHDDVARVRAVLS